MRADEYVVAELQQTKELNNQLVASNSLLRQDFNKIEHDHKVVCSLFEVNKLSANTGYSIVVNNVDGSYAGTVAYAWTTDIDKIPEPFWNLLNALGLTLPDVDVDEKDFENNKEIFDQAIEIVKELQKDND